MKKILILWLLLQSAVTGYAQELAVWNYVHPGVSSPGLIIDDTDTLLIIWGWRYDTCGYANSALLVLDTTGTLVVDTTYELASCNDERSMRFASNGDGPGYYMITSNDNNTPSDSLFVHFIDSNFALQWQQYLGGRYVRSPLVSYYGRNYISTDYGTSSNRNVFRFYQPGIVDTFTQVTHSYFNVAPRHIFAHNGSIYEIDYRDYDSAFVCMVYDTLGNFQNSFSFDANVNEGEGIQYITLHNNRLFHVNGSAFNSPVYPASTDLSGNVNWIGTVNYQYKGASLDTINNVAYILTTSASGARMFSYNFNTGARIDSTIVDSIFINTARIKSGSAPGVFLFYQNVYAGKTVLDQYDEHFNLIWRGYVSHPTCTLMCTPDDLNFDPLGNLYTVSHCSNSCISDSTFLISKFSPSLVSVPENNPEQHVSLFPNPASTEVRIQIHGQGGNNSVNVLNSLGEVVRTNKFAGTSYQMSVDQLPSGVYIVQIITESGSYHAEKLIIQH